MIKSAVKKGLQEYQTSLDEKKKNN
ncbi:hypothetical protein [Faecalimonas sp.]